LVAGSGIEWPRTVRLKEHSTRKREKQGQPRIGHVTQSGSFHSRQGFSTFGAQATAGAAMAAARAGASQAYTMFGSATRGVEGYNEQLSSYGKDRTLADNNAMSRRQANEANTDSQVARKEEWSRGLNEVPVLGGPLDWSANGIWALRRLCLVDSRAHSR
jgi:hypothetical protein